MNLLLISTFLLGLSANATRWVDRTLHSMTTDEKIGQLLIPRASGGFRNVESDDFRKFRQQMDQFHVGGFHVYGGDAAGMAVLINDLQRFSKVPLLITADLEGGAGFVIPAATRFPLGMAIGAAGNDQLAYDAARATASEAKAIGIGVNFYPVADVQNNPGNPIINIRSFGEDVARVSALTRAYVRGTQDAGLLATAKHFPGHGDVSQDTHLELPVLNVSRERLESVELPPFRAAIDAGVGAIMSAHINLPALEPEKGLPATLSKNVLTNLLRNDMHFKGLIFTDALDMHAITKNFGEGDAAVRAFEAGADILLFVNAEPTFNALKQAVDSGRISAARLDESVRRILEAKARLGLDHYKPADVNTLSNIVGSQANRDLAQRIQEASITLVRDEKRVLPIRPSDQRVLAINLLDSNSGWREGPVGKVIEAEIPKRFTNAVTLQIDDRTTANEYSMVRKMADIVDVVIVAAFIRVASYKGSIDLSAQQISLLGDLSKMNKPFVFALFGSPYLLHHVPELPSYILTYDTNPGAELAAVKAITGEIPFAGKLPISLPGLYPIGHGLQPNTR